MSPSSANRKKAERWGRFAGYWACGILLAKGYAILALRAKTPAGEVDIIAAKSGSIIAVEVKARQTEEQGRWSMPDQQWDRRLRGLDAWITRHRRSAHTKPRRFDLLIILPFGRFRHIRDAWRP